MCEKCFRKRKLKHVMGPGLPEKGLDICRPCTNALKLAIKVRDKQ